MGAHKFKVILTTSGIGQGIAIRAGCNLESTMKQGRKLGVEAIRTADLDSSLNGLLVTIGEGMAKFQGPIDAFGIDAWSLTR